MNRGITDIPNHLSHESLDEFEIQPDSNTGFHGNR